jgi:hypothetical protein
MIAGNQFCPICCDKILSLARQRAGVKICAECDPTVPKRIELVIRPKLLALIEHPPSATDDILFGQTCDVVKKRRPDFCWQGTDRVVILEVDERGGHGSTNYTPECDLGWIMDMNSAIVQLFQKNSLNGGRVPLVSLVRFNPDEYDGPRTSLDQRIGVISARINYLLKRPIDEFCALRPEVEFHYYHSKCVDKLDYIRSNPTSVRLVDGGPN